MKRIIALLLVLVMALSLSACGGKKEEVVEAVDEEIDAAVDTVEETIEDAVEEAVADAFGHTADYWCERFGANRCPFSFTAVGLELDYYFRNGGKPDYWIYTEENTDGWYINDGYIISADGVWGIKIEDMDSFSSCCSYECSPYLGEKLSDEERKEQKPGIFYVINSYTPVRTNWGVELIKDADAGEDLPDSYDYKVYGLTDSLKDQEWFTFYIDNIDDQIEGEKASLWAFKHRDRKDYPEILTDELIEEGVKLGDFEYNEENNHTYLQTFIPNADAGGIEAGEEVDLLMTYGSETENITVGVISVNTIPAN